MSVTRSSEPGSLPEVRRSGSDGMASSWGSGFMEFSLRARRPAGAGRSGGLGQVFVVGLPGLRSFAAEAGRPARAARRLQAGGGQGLAKAHVLLADRER